MIELLLHIRIALVPLIITSILHMVLVKMNLLAFLKVPVWQRGFGENKTWRGFVFVPMMNGVLVPLVAPATMMLHHTFTIGFLLGVCYLVAELPNSFFKRRMGIRPGEQADKHKGLFFILDKVDSAFGVALGYYFLSDITTQMALALFATNSIVHMLVAFVLVRFKIKAGI